MDRFRLNRCRHGGRFEILGRLPHARTVSVPVVSVRAVGVRTVIFGSDKPGDRAVPADERVS